MSPQHQDFAVLTFFCCAARQANEDSAKEGQQVMSWNWADVQMK